MSDPQRERILEKYNHQCVHCGSEENLEIDHIIPVSKGGEGSDENLQVLCRSCNRSKSNKIPWEDFIKVDDDGNLLIDIRLWERRSFHRNFDEFYKLMNKAFSDDEKAKRMFQGATGQEEIVCGVG